VIVDRFGNLETSISQAALAAIGVATGSELELGVGAATHRLPFGRTFGSVPRGALGAHVDSAGLLAIAVNLGDASARLGLGAGDRFTLRRAG
jgi:S-adenosylmethionine hydrolase